MYEVIRPKKSVINKDDTVRILSFYNDEIAEQKVRSDDKSDDQMAVGDTKLRNKKLFNKTKAMGENILGIRMGAHVTTLVEKKVDLDPIAYSLYCEYHDFLTELLMEYKGYEAYKLTEQPEISNRNVLVRELLLRFAMQALCNKNEGSSDGQIVTVSMIQFVNELKKSNVLLIKYSKGDQFNKFSEKLFSGLIPWIKLFEGVITTVKEMNQHKDAVISAAKHINSFKKIIIFRVIAELVQFTKCDLKYAEQLTDTHLQRTLSGYERKALETIKNDAILPKDTKNLSIDNATSLLCRQHLVAGIKVVRPDSRIDYVYEQLYRLNQLNSILEKISNLITLTGWLPFLSGIIDFTSFSNDLDKIIAACQLLQTETDSIINNLIRNRFPNLKLALVRHEVSNISLSSKLFSVSRALQELNNPELLRKIAIYFKNEFATLKQLSRDSNCNIINYDRLREFNLSESRVTEFLNFGEEASENYDDAEFSLSGSLSDASSESSENEARFPQAIVRAKKTSDHSHERKGSKGKDKFTGSSSNGKGRRAFPFMKTGKKNLFFI